MTSRERIEATCAHKQPDKLAVDFGGGFQTGIHVSMIYQLRQALGLDQPGRPVKVVEICQMLGEIAPDLQDALGIDTVSLCGTGTMFGFPAKEFKEWRMHNGTPNEVRTQVRERIEIFNEGGGFVFCSIHNVQARTPIKNLLAMFDALRNQ